MTQDATDKGFDLTDYLEDLLRPDQGEIEKNISKVDDHHLLIEGEEYQVLVDHANGYRYDAFFDRYQDFFAKYDYIVGDWASDQLRLRGFYQIGTPKVPYDQRIETLEDYLNEYCNFGASYFVIGKTKSLLNYPQLTEDFRAGKFASLPSKSRNQKRSFATKSPHYKKISATIAKDRASLLIRTVAWSRTGRQAKGKIILNSVKMIDKLASVIRIEILRLIRDILRLSRKSPKSFFREGILCDHIKVILLI